ncbi:MAG: hypothetical protein ACE5MK_13250, partial [Acidobacteriota bacterium]
LSPHFCLSEHYCRTRFLTPVSRQIQKMSQPQLLIFDLVAANIVWGEVKAGKVTHRRFLKRSLNTATLLGCYSGWPVVDMDEV